VTCNKPDFLEKSGFYQICACKFDYLTMKIKDMYFYNPKKQMKLSEFVPDFPKQIEI